jgi:hypothetical protein
MRVVSDDVVAIITVVDNSGIEMYMPLLRAIGGCGACR